MLLKVARGFVSQLALAKMFTVRKLKSYMNYKSFLVAFFFSERKCSLHNFFIVFSIHKSLKT